MAEVSGDSPLIGGQVWRFAVGRSGRRGSLRPVVRWLVVAAWLILPEPWLKGYQRHMPLRPGFTAAGLACPMQLPKWRPASARSIISVSAKPIGLSR